MPESLFFDKVAGLSLFFDKVAGLFNMMKLLMKPMQFLIKNGFSILKPYYRLQDGAPSCKV